MKIDLNVGRELTINTGNFSNIKPSVSLTLKDVDVEKADAAYMAMNEIVSSLLHLEMMSATNQMENRMVMDTERLDEAVDTLDKNLEVLKKL